MITVTEFYERIDKQDITKKCFEPLGNKDYSLSGEKKITTFSWPLFYLFDSEINKDFGSSVDIRKYLRQTLNLDELFSLTSTNIFDITVNNHSTILYKFTYDNRKYIYYSNSGLGIKNQLNYNDITACKILYFNEKYVGYDNICQTISKIVNNIIASNIIAGDLHSNIKVLLKGYDANNKVFHLWETLSGQTLINHDEYVEILKYVIKRDTNWEQKLCYVLLNFICSKSSDVIECTFNHVLNGRENDTYKTNNYNSLSITKLLNISIDHYKVELKEPVSKVKLEEPVSEIKVEEPVSEITLDFNTYIDEINKNLKSLDSSTIQYKLNKSFNLKYDKIYGLFNNIQQSGSCTFYSYYNLALNMKILNEYKKKDGITKVIESFQLFHYHMIYLLCLSNDTKFTQNINYDDRNLYNSLFIYKIIYDNKLLDEIIKFYNSDTLFFNNNNTITTDKLLNYKIIGELENQPGITKINITTKFNELRKYLLDILYKIRNNEEINIDIMNNGIDSIFANIIIDIKIFDRIFNSNKYERYYNGIKEIYKVYLILLIEIYKNTHGLDLSLVADSDSNHFLHVFTTKDYVHSIKREDKQTSNNPMIDNYLDTANNMSLLNYFNISEALNMYQLLKHHNYNLINYINLKYKTKIQCTMIYSNSDYDYEFYNHHNINLRLDLNFDKEISKKTSPSVGKELILEIYVLYSKYMYLKKNDIYLDKINDSIEDIKRNILNSYLKTKKIESYGLTIAIMILSDSKYLLLDKNINSYSDKNVSLLEHHHITDDTNIYIGDWMLFKDEIIKILNENNEDKFTKILSLYNNYIDDYLWCTKYNIIPENSEFKYEEDRYIIVTNNDDNNNIKLILSRFGLSIFDTSEYLLLFNKNNIVSINNFNSEKINIIDNKAGNFIILIKKYEICIIINYKADNLIDIDNCYIIDKSLIKKRLIFNLNKNKFPFVSLIPMAAPYLCYLDNDIYNIAFFISSSTKSIKYNELHKILYNPIEIDVIDFYMCTFKIAPSYIFPLIETFNLDKWYKLFDYYDTNQIKLDSNIIKNIYTNTIDEQTIKTISATIENIKRILLATISNIEEKKLENILVDEFSKKKKNEDELKGVVTSFLSENRLCKSSKSRDNIDNIDNINAIISEYEKLKNSIVYELKDNDNFIINNLDKFILMMEYNIIINLSKLINKDINCWDSQYILTSLNSIKNFNENINTYYIFELLFLLQNNYFFKNTQMQKYISIRNELISNNPNLTLHQFMMGKGKTSVITPLLSFATLLLTKKIPTIITANHLILDTKKYISFTEHIISSNKKINVFSDFTAKKRWIEYTDITLQEKITEEKKKYFEKT